MATPQKNQGFWWHHSLGIVSCLILILWIVFYFYNDPGTHWGSFFGNAIADWSGVVVTVYATKYMYEIGSSESRKPPKGWFGPVQKFLLDHSLTIFLLITGIGWVILYVHSNSESKWGQVTGNIVSEWTQIFGMVVLTKRLIEKGSKESSQ